MPYEKIAKCINCKKDFLRTNIGKKYCSGECNLFSHIEKKDDGCWEWKNFTSLGYGLIPIKGKQYKAHIASYLLFIGEIPKGKLVCHKCENRKCVNPDHLFLGTRKENLYQQGVHCEF